MYAAGFEHQQNRRSGGQSRGPDHRGRNCFMHDPGLNAPDSTTYPTATDRTDSGTLRLVGGLLVRQRNGTRIRGAADVEAGRLAGCAAGRQLNCGRLSELQQTAPRSPGYVVDSDVDVVELRTSQPRCLAAHDRSYGVGDAI